MTPFGIELFDLFFHEEKSQKVYLYHVKAGINQNTRDACSQIRNAAKIIQGTIIGKNERASFEKFAELAGDEPFQQFGGKESFFSLFKRENIVFVYAVSEFTALKSRSLTQERDRRLFLTEHDCDENSISCLKTLGYIDENKWFTDKFLLETKDTFVKSVADKLNCTLTSARELRDRLYRIGGSVFKSTIVRLEIISLARELEELGFGFQICEILHSESVENLIGRQITWGQAAYRLEATELDEASALHALQGTWKTERYFYENAKENFIAKLRASQNPQPVNEFIKQNFKAEFDQIASTHAKIVKKVTKLFQEFMKAWLKKTGISPYEIQWQQFLSSYTGSIVENPKIREFFEKFARPGSVKNLAEIKNKITAIETGLSENTRLLEAAIDLFQQPSYRLTVKDLEIAASLFNVSVTLLEYGTNNEQPFNQDVSQPILICHYEGSFIRCNRVNSS